MSPASGIKALALAAAVALLVGLCSGPDEISVVRTLTQAVTDAQAAARLDARIEAATRAMERSVRADIEGQP